ncbi:MAG: M23 family metallopeptidase [Eubacteriales bacterium]|nr:M23 family metallopeptidase [Eubacteriales bacterium]MDD4768512.1 M23 family metallopeptidase [Eubacteriales bacterium]
MARKSLWAGAILLVIALFAGSAWLLLTPRWVYQVSVEGSPVGMVKNLEEYKQIIEEIQSRAEERWDCDLVMNEKVAATRVRMWSPQLSPASVRAGIEAAATYKTKGWAIVINGDTVAIVDREQTAKDILEEVKAQYLSQDKNCSLVSVDLQEAVSIESTAVTPDVLMDKEAVLATLVCGREEIKAYVVKRGDTLSGISRSHSVPVDTLRDANAIEGDAIHVGQVLSLQTSKALLHVKTVEEVAATETIARSIKYKANPDKSVRADQVVDAGSDGSRQVIYQVVKVNGNEIKRKQINATVTKEPQAKVIMTGIGYWPARPTGMFRFPVNGGRISSRFGERRSYGPHRGVDIANPRGTPIHAAASGTVTAKTRGSSYGRYIVLQHANGYSTLYAHLSEFASSLRVGSSVVRGQVIGRVGNSGRSSGPHLHWEVRRYGEALNPLNFFGN